MQWFRVLLILSLLCAACSSSDDAGESTSSTTVVTSDGAPDDTAYGQFLSLIEEDGDTVETALIRFQLAFGPVDGVESPAADDTVPFSGTDAVDAIERHWDDLDDGQRIAVATTLARWLGLLDDDATLDENALGASQDGEDEGAMAPRMLRHGRPAIDEEVPTAERTEWEERAEAASAWLKERLPFDEGLEFELVFVEPDGAGAGARTAGIGRASVLLELIADRLGLTPPDIAPEFCNIYLEEVRAETNSAALESAMAHELFHCWSLMTLGLNGHIRTEGWVQEGIASWVGEMYAGGSSYSTNWWGRYFRKSSTEGSWALFPSEYTAVGFWSAVDQLGGDLFDRIPAVMALSAANGDAGTYEGVMAPLSAEAQAAIASTAAQRPWGPAWNLVGPGVRGTGRQPTATRIDVGEQEEWSAGIGQQVNRSYAPQSPDGGWFVVGIAASGAGRFRWESGQTFAVTGGSASAGYCVGAPCVCESTGEPPPLDLEDVAGDAILATAITGLPGAPTDVTLQVLFEEDVCDPVECKDAPELVVYGDPTGGRPAGGILTAYRGPADECITVCPAGTWQADAEDASRYLTSLPGSRIAQATLNSGTIVVTFGQDWSFEQVIADVDLTGVVDGKNMQRFISGRTSGEWTIQDDEFRLQINEVETTTETIIDGSSTGRASSSVDPSLLGDVFTFVPTCDGDQLDLVANYFIPVPENWTRVGS